MCEGGFEAAGGMRVSAAEMRCDAVIPTEVLIDSVD